MKIKLLLLLIVLLVIAGCTTQVNAGYPSGTFTNNAQGQGHMMESPPALSFKGNTVGMSLPDGNTQMFKYTLSGTYTLPNGGFITLKNSATGATSKEPFEYVASENLVVFGNLSYYK